MKILEKPKKYYFWLRVENHRSISLFKPGHLGARDEGKETGRRGIRSNNIPEAKKGGRHL